MKKYVFISVIGLSIAFFSFKVSGDSGEGLRKIYSQSPGSWPAPFVDINIQWKELGLLPPSPLENKRDSLKNLIELGKFLFFDTRLSGSGKISCATCHQPELSWTDGKQKSLGHEGALTKRNSPTIQNTWFYEKLFWDGRAKNLEDQAFAPINSESEMHNEMHLVMISMNKLNSYKKLFKDAFGTDDISPDRLTIAIATFERTIISNRSRFDEFLEGNKYALSGSEIKGLHLFRTKARCINCHNGPLFTDNSFHNNGFANGDNGLYTITHRDDDLGKLKTPSLRDVMKTRPWMHDGSLQNIDSILDRYDKVNMPGIDKLIEPLRLTKKEKADLSAFLSAISTSPLEFKRPTLPE